VHGRRVSRLPDLWHRLILPADPSLHALPADLPEQVSRALREDIGSGDVTAALVPAAQTLRARVISREAAVVAGCPWFHETFNQLDPAVQLQWQVKDGMYAAAGTALCELSGPARSILTGERTALNFLQLLSGTATITAQYVAAVSGTACRILDTRKTLPGLRTAQKYAVLCGGGSNHRIGLFDQVLLKENHIAVAGSIAAAVANARSLSPGLKVEVETENLAEFDQALDAAADIIMLDEFCLADMRSAVARNRSRTKPAKLEVSGGVTLDSIRSIAETGVDFISVGALTKHARAIDLSMRFVG
jgi:nicotinate-nucleotide pyrophosphorylase (carboxylating)